MRNTRRNIDRASYYLRRNVLNYRYIKKNILMTLLVVAISVMVFALIRYGENSDPLADELYLHENTDIVISETEIMNETSIDVVMELVRSHSSKVAVSDSNVVASYPGSSNAQMGTDKEAGNDDILSAEGDRKEGTLTADGVRVRAEAVAYADVLTVAYIGEVYEVRSENADWVEIVLDDGTSGFVVADYIVVANVIKEEQGLDE